MLAAQSKAAARGVLTDFPSEEVRSRRNLISMALTVLPMDLGRVKVGRCA